jgi:hypothetical protein
MFRNDEQNFRRPIGAKQGYLRKHNMPEENNLCRLYEQRKCDFLQNVLGREELNYKGENSDMIRDYLNNMDMSMNVGGDKYPFLGPGIIENLREGQPYILNSPKYGGCRRCNRYIEFIKNTNKALSYINNAEKDGETSFSKIYKYQLLSDKDGNSSIKHIVALKNLIPYLYLRLIDIEDAIPESFELEDKEIDTIKTNIFNIFFDIFEYIESLSIERKCRKYPKIYSFYNYGIHNRELICKLLKEYDEEILSYLEAGFKNEIELFRLLDRLPNSNNGIYMYGNQRPAKIKYYPNRYIDFMENDDDEADDFIKENNCEDMSFYTDIFKYSIVTKEQFDFLIQEKAYLIRLYDIEKEIKGIELDELTIEYFKKNLLNLHEYNIGEIIDKLKMNNTLKQYPKVYKAALYDGLIGKELNDIRYVFSDDILPYLEVGYKDCESLYKAIKRYNPEPRYCLPSF